VPIETTGLLGGSRTASASRIASSTPGAGFACSTPTGEDPARRHRGVHPDPPLLEVDGALAAVGLVVRDDDVRLDRVVRHRQQPHARLPAGAQRLGDLGERVAEAEHPGADEVRRDVAVAEREPLRLRAVAASSSATVNVSSVRPQPCSSWTPPPSVYMTVSRSGQTRRPWSVTSSAVLPTTVTSWSPAGLEVTQETAQEPGAADDRRREP
jgi:hypothetical protein